MPTAVTVYTDFVCPFCFIAERSSLVRLQKEFDVTLDWRGYELHPETPPGGRPLTDLFPKTRLVAMHEHLKSYAKTFGITDLVTGEHLSNTRKAIAVAEFARDEGKLDAFRERAFDAHWRQEKNLEDDAVLRALAIDAGLDGDRAVSASRDRKYLDRIDERRKEAESRGVTGIPTFVIGDNGLVGCQPYEILAEFVSECGAERRKSPPEGAEGRAKPDPARKS